MWQEKLFFDRQDYELLTLVNAIVSKRGTAKAGHGLVDANLHPHGIKTLAYSREMRVAYAVARLIDSLEVGDSHNRLNALRALYDEVLNSAKTSFRRNTARVLIEIMKDLLRSHGDMRRQIYLASDFRRAARGNPRVVRELLDHYGLVEMPEDWSQLAFDHHVHDANTKGRKNPTHLIMDAWLKGIKYLTIIYYSCIEEAAACEVLSAAAIVGIKVNIGFEFAVPQGDKFIHLIWSPGGYESADEFLSFWAEPPMQHLMALGRDALTWRQRYVFKLFEKWNDDYRLRVASELGLNAEDVQPISTDAFKQFVGIGHPSMVHLAEFIFLQLSPVIEQKRLSLQQSMQDLDANEDASEKIKEQDEFLQNLTSSIIYNNYIIPEKNPEILSPYVPSHEADMPEIFSFSPLVLLDWLTSISSKGMVTLNIAELSCEDVLELLWQCQGMITHIEVFNLREWSEGYAQNASEIVMLQHTINEASIPRLKHLVLNMFREREQRGPLPNESLKQHEQRLLTLRDILNNIQTFKCFYDTRPLRSRMGSDATGRPGSDIGMGMVFVETLPKQAQKVLAKAHNKIHIPFHITVQYQVRYTPLEPHVNKNLLTKMIRLIPGRRYHGDLKSQEWHSRSSSIRSASTGGNLASLGNVKLHTNKEKIKPTPPLQYLNSNLANVLKVLLGFISAAIAFQYTQTWWFLAWFGPIIWFGITGVRNIIQSVVAGGGLHRSSLLSWNDYVSWSRLCDSLMYTGFSVPLLELGVRILLLQEGLGITVVNHTVLVYSVMAIVNGLYISWHNLVRGFPMEAIVGNLFRSALAIPMAILFNGIVFEVLYLSNVEQPGLYMQMGAAIISKLASDTVAALIEGYADHKNNVRMRRWDYSTKFDQVFKNYTKLELLFPEDDVLSILMKPKKVLKQISPEHEALKQAIIIDALDLMYFWMYRPRAQEVCKDFLSKMSKEERLIYGYLQLVLTREREVSKLFVNGLLGRNFGEPLAFYLAKNKKYLKAILPLCALDYHEQKAA